MNQAEIHSENLEVLSTLDNLTRVANRRRFDSYLEDCCQHKQGDVVSLILADIDFFKKYNDTYGHHMGDECLKRVANAMQSVFRCAQDLVSRYGGEEFAILLPNTDADEAIELVTTLRRRIQKSYIRHEKSKYGRLTLSFGIASLAPQGKSTEDTLIAAADAALYQAKSQGRNCVALSKHFALKYIHISK